MPLLRVVCTLSSDEGLLPLFVGEYALMFSGLEVAGVFQGVDRLGVDRSSSFVGFSDVYVKLVTLLEISIAVVRRHHAEIGRVPEAVSI